MFQCQRLAGVTFEISCEVGIFLLQCFAELPFLIPNDLLYSLDIRLNNMVIVLIERFLDVFRDWLVVDYGIYILGNDCSFLALVLFNKLMIFWWLCRVIISVSLLRVVPVSLKHRKCRLIQVINPFDVPILIWCAGHTRAKFQCVLTTLGETRPFVFLLSDHRALVETPKSFSIEDCRLRSFLNIAHYREWWRVEKLLLTTSEVCCDI